MVVSSVVVASVVVASVVVASVVVALVVVIRGMKETLEAAQSTDQHQSHLQVTGLKRLEEHR